MKPLSLVGICVAMGLRKEPTTATGSGSSQNFDVMVSCGARTVVVVEGEVDIATAPDLRAALARAQTGLHQAAVPEPLVVDLSAVTFLDASGLGALAGAAWRARGHGGRVVLRSPSRMTIRLLEITDLLGAFDIDRGDDHRASATIDVSGSGITAHGSSGFAADRVKWRDHLAAG